MNLSLKACRSVFLIFNSVWQTGASGRNSYLDVMLKMAEKYKKKMWGWVALWPRLFGKDVGIFRDNGEESCVRFSLFTPLRCMLTSLGSESCSDTDCCEKEAKRLESLEEKCWYKLVPKDSQQTSQVLGELSPDQWGNTTGWMVVYPVFGKKSTVVPGQHFVMFETCDLSHFKHCLL